MSENAIRKVVIVGGGTSGWMSAAALCKFLDLSECEVMLVESEHIGTVGVGEATLPHLRFFNETLGIDEAEFMRATNATYKMGIEFCNWGALGQRYIHPFGDYGVPIDTISFHHFWRALHKQGKVGAIDAYSLPVVAAGEGKFDYPSRDQQSILATFGYAFHLDASLYAAFLREFSEKRGVKRKEGKICQVIQADSGEVQSLRLEDGTDIEGELFIDCSGFRSLLLGKTLGVGFEDWSQWLACDRAVAMPCAGVDNPLPYTKAIARDCGWQWRIPLRHRVGNGHVYCSSYMSDDEAHAILANSLEGEALAEPNFVRFKAGHRVASWEKNCIAVGLAGGFLEPLESTSIYLIQIAITKMLELFPCKEFKASVKNEFNRQMDTAFGRVRDFLILHYHATQRNDTPFWEFCRNMEVPEALAHKIALFRRRGYVVQYDDGIFLEPSWLAVYLGQGILPEAVDPRVHKFDMTRILSECQKLEARIAAAVATMPSHQQALERYTDADAKAIWPGASMNLYGRNG